MTEKTKRKIQGVITEHLVSLLITGSKSIGLILIAMLSLITFISCNNSGNSIPTNDTNDKQIITNLGVLVVLHMLFIVS